MMSCLGARVSSSCRVISRSANYRKLVEAQRSYVTQSKPKLSFFSNRRKSHVSNVLKALQFSTLPRSTLDPSNDPYTQYFDSKLFERIEFKVPFRSNDPTLNLSIFALRYISPIKEHSKKEPLLLVHGHPENLLTYRHLAPRLAKSAGRDIVVVDLRGYGRSDAPPTNSTIGIDIDPYTQEQLLHRYSKREMARDLAELMEYLGYKSFSVLAHDRGGRVTHRLALDFPDVVKKVMILDIVPALDLYEHTDAWFAKSYFHWFFFLQPYPLPEHFMEKSTKAYLERAVKPFPSKEDVNDQFSLSVMKDYLRQNADPAYAHATIEDYRASGPGGVDQILDLEGRKNSIRFHQPLRIHWGNTGVNELLFKHDGCFALWKKACSGPISGGSMKSGHFMTEEVPEQIEASALEFFT